MKFDGQDESLTLGQRLEKDGACSAFETEKHADTRL